MGSSLSSDVNPLSVLQGSTRSYVPASLLDNIITSLQSLPDGTFSQVFNQHLQTLDSSATSSFGEFKSFIQERARLDDTWRLWVQFTFQDALAYVGLFLAIRSGDWELRMASMKSMASVFTAFDHPLYQKLISMNVADILDMPDTLKSMFRQGAFVVSICERPWHSVAIDESHEMLINKDCKTSIVRPLADYINLIARYMPYRSKAVKNLSNKYFLPKRTNTRLFIHLSLPTQMIISVNRTYLPRLQQ